MKSTIRLGKVFGVPIGLHYSWFLVLAFFSWSLGNSFLPSRYPGWADTTYWTTGFVTALLLFVSVLLHELAHSLVARARGFPVEGITLFLLGGVTQLGAEARRARDEFVIAVVGPLTSLLIFAVLLGVDQAIQARATPTAAVVFWLWRINLVLALFNLLPAFPMDGGRLLHSVVWGATGSMARATRVASRGGQFVGLLLIALGLFEGLRGSWPAGTWFALIGLFIFSMASRSRRDIGAADDEATLDGESETGWERQRAGELQQESSNLEGDGHGSY